MPAKMFARSKKMMLTSWFFLIMPEILVLPLPLFRFYSLFDETA